MVLLDKIYDPEEQLERATKALKLNGGPAYDYDPRLLVASSFSSNRKPMLRIKRLSSGASARPIIKLKGASSSGLQRQLLERQKVTRFRKNKCRKSIEIELNIIPFCYSPF